MIFILLYVGPGMGGGLFAAILGIIVSLIVFLFAILWYPFKKIYRKIRGNKLEEE
jgi:O-antigen/teichoic acid export membrane protein